jgi:hypothetical protein
MDIHKNARLTVHGRERIAWLLQSGHSVAEVVEMLGVATRRCASGGTATPAVWEGQFAGDDGQSKPPAGRQGYSGPPYLPQG